MNQFLQRSWPRLTSALLISIWISAWLWLLAWPLSWLSSWRCRLFCRRAGNEWRRRVLAGARAIAFDRTAAAEHHLGVVVLRVAGHHCRQMLEGMPVGRPELGGEIDVAAKFEHAIVIALEDGVGLFGRQLELLEILRLVGLEGAAIVVLHQRHAEHVDAVALARAFGIEHERAGDVVVDLRFASHQHLSDFALHIYSATKLGNVSIVPPLVPATRLRSPRELRRGLGRAEARSAKAEGGDPAQQTLESDQASWLPAFAGMSGVPV